MPTFLYLEFCWLVRIVIPTCFLRELLLIKKKIHKAHAISVWLHFFILVTSLKGFTLPGGHSSNPINLGILVGTWWQYSCCCLKRELSTPISTVHFR